MFIKQWKSIKNNGYNYKPYELIKVNDIIYLDNNNNNDKKEELENQIFQKEQKIK